MRVITRTNVIYERNPLMKLYNKVSNNGRLSKLRLSRTVRNGIGRNQMRINVLEGIPNSLTSTPYDAELLLTK